MESKGGTHGEVFRTINPEYRAPQVDCFNSTGQRMLPGAVQNDVALTSPDDASMPTSKHEHHLNARTLPTAFCAAAIHFQTRNAEHHKLQPSP